MTAARAGRFLLLVNPSAGGGRARELLPRVEAAMRAAGLEHRAVLTTGPRARLRGGPRGGRGRRDPGGDQRRRADRPGRRRARRHRGRRMGVIPGGRGNDFARVLGIPDEVDAAVAVLAAGAAARDRRRRGQRPALPLHRQLRLRLRRQPDRQRGEAGSRGNLVYAYAALRALVAWKPARFTITLDGERTSCAATRSPPPTAGPTAAACSSPPTPSSTTACSTWSPPREAGKLHFLLNLPKVFDGKHVDNPEVERRARGRGPDRGRPPVRRLRRRRPRSPTCRRRSACCRAPCA